MFPLKMRAVCLKGSDIMEQIGEVVELRGANAVVRIKRTSACGENCSECSGECKPSASVVTAVNGLSAKVGDTVKLQMNSASFLLLAFIGYILPIIVCIASYFIVKSVTDSVLFADISAVSSIAIVLLIFFIVDKLPFKRRIFSSRIIKILR